MKTILKKILNSNTLKLIKSNFKSDEEKEILLKRKDFYSQFLTNPKDIYFDIGANYGNRIEPISKDGFKIIAVEPQKKCINFLKRKYGNRIEIIPKGLGETEELRTFYISNSHTISTFSEDWIKDTTESGRFKQYSWEKKEEIELTTLDVLINQYGIPKFIKIDVEGYETEVLQGLTQPIEYISFEYCVPENQHSIIECIDRLVKISKAHKIEFNYSVGESMEWALSDWLSPDQMKKEISSTKFIKTNFGDIYSKIYVD